MIHSLDRGLSILEYLSKRKSAGVTEIASAFDIDKSTVSRILSTMVQHNMVYKNEETQKYSLSVGPLLFSYHVASNHQIMDLARPVLQRLTELTQETAHLCAMHNNRVFVIDQIKSAKNRFMKDPVMPGMTEPFHCSAVGKCILAYMQPAEAHRLLEASEMSDYTDNTICDISELFTQFDQIREQGYALDLEEYSSKVCCVAVPVFDVYGYASHSLGISGESDLMRNPERFLRCVNYLKDSGKKLSEQYRALGNTKNL